MMKAGQWDGFNKLATNTGRVAGTQPVAQPFRGNAGQGFNKLATNTGRVAGTQPSGVAPMPPSVSATNTAPAASPYGTESGPGILEQWFNQRASGTDPGYDYAVSRGLKDLNTASAARGNFNSGAAAQQSGDYLANMGAQREAQLDSLAGGASGEHQGRLNSMFGQGQALASGQAGLAGQYDLGAAGAWSNADVAQLQMMLQKAGVDSQAQQGLINNILGGAKAYAALK